MKKIYRILLIISTVCFLYTLSTFMIETIDLVVPDTKTTVIVENWDKKRTSNKIFKEIKSYAQQTRLIFIKLILVSITKVKQRKIFLRSHKEKQLNFIMIVSVFLPKQIFMIVAN